MAGKSIGYISPPFIYSGCSGLGRGVCLPNKTIIYHRQVDKLAQLVGQQVRLIIATLPQFSFMQWYRHQNFSRYRIAADIILQQLSQGHNQVSEVPVLQLMDSLTDYPIKSKWRPNTIYLCLPADTTRTEYAARLRSATPRTN
jgi:hypothetical protein